MDEKKNWVDFREVKEAVSMEMVLAHYGVKVRRVNATYLRGKCPLPSHSSKDSKESFGVQAAKNAWACQSQSCVAARGGRKGGNVLDFVAAMESCTVRDAALKLHAWFLNNQSDSQAARPASSAKLVAEKKDTVGESDDAASDDSGAVNEPLKFSLKGVDTSHPYLAKRGITQETAAHFGVGFFPGKGSMSGRVVIPIHNERGELVAYAGRAINDTEPRYKLPANFHKWRVVFNLHRARATESRIVVVVEGFFDALKVHQAGFPCVVALMGSSLSERQEQHLVEDFDLVLLMLDGDDPGQAACREIAPRLARLLAVRIADVPSGAQPDQLSSDETRRILGSL